MSIFHRFVLLCLALAGAVALAGCAPKTIYVDRPVEVRVPVTVPCMAERPAEVVSLRDTLTREEWDALTTDQRENLMGAQALLRKIYGDRLTAASAGCR